MNQISDKSRDRQSARLVPSAMPVILESRKEALRKGKKRYRCGSSCFLSTSLSTHGKFRIGEGKVDRKTALFFKYSVHAGLRKRSRRLVESLSSERDRGSRCLERSFPKNADPANLKVRYFLSGGDADSRLSLMKRVYYARKAASNSLATVSCQSEAIASKIRDQCGIN